MGDLIQFRPRNAPKVSAHDVQIIGTIPSGAMIIDPRSDIPDHAQIISANGVTLYYTVEPDRDEEFAMDDDNAPCALNPDPFERDYGATG